LHELLGAFGNGVIDRGEFWRMMAEQRLTDADIDKYCTGEISADHPKESNMVSDPISRHRSRFFTRHDRRHVAAGADIEGRGDSLFRGNLRPAQ